MWQSSSEDGLLKLCSRLSCTISTAIGQQQPPLWGDLARLADRRFWCAAFSAVRSCCHQVVPAPCGCHFAGLTRHMASAGRAPHCGKHAVREVISAGHPCTISFRKRLHSRVRDCSHMRRFTTAYRPLCWPRLGKQFWISSLVHNCNTGRRVRLLCLC